MTTYFGILAVAAACGGSSGDELDALRRELGEVKQAQAELQSTVATLQRTVAALPGARVVAQQKPRGEDAEKREVVRRIPIGASPRKGNELGAVTVVQFIDFQSADCRTAARLADELLAAYPDNVQVVFKHNPLPRHRDARRAAKAAWAAHQQGKFWEMHDAIFAGSGARITVEDLHRYAQQIGLDMERFEADMASPSADQAVMADRRLAGAMRVGGAPAYFVNGRRVEDRSPAGVRAKVEEQLAQRTPGGP
ncbi:MAG: DsbA family protein [Thermodesulfobacteriota bacterium]